MDGAISTPPILVPVTKAARLLSLGRTRIYELLGQGSLEARKLGKLTMITTASIQKFVDELPRR